MVKLWRTRNPDRTAPNSLQWAHCATVVAGKVPLARPESLPDGLRLPTVRYDHQHKWPGLQGRQSDSITARASGLVKLKFWPGRERRVSHRPAGPALAGRQAPWPSSQARDKFRFLALDSETFRGQGGSGLESGYSVVLPVRVEPARRRWIAATARRRQPGQGPRANQIRTPPRRRRRDDSV